MSGPGATESGPRELAGLLARRLREAGQGEGETVSVAELHRVLIPYHECRDRLGYATKAEYDLALLRLLRDGEVVRVEEGRLSEAVERELDSPEPGLAFLRNFAAAQLSVRPLAVEEGAAEGGAAAVEGPSNGDRAADGDGGGSGPPLREARAEAGRPGRDASGDEASGGERSGGDRTADAPGSPGTAAGSLEWLETLEPGAGGEAASGEAASGQSGVRGSDQAGVRGSGEEVASGPCWQCGEALPERDGLRYCPFCGSDQTERRCLSCGEELERTWGFCPRCGTEVLTPAAPGDAGGRGP